MIFDGGKTHEEMKNYLNYRNINNKFPKKFPWPWARNTSIFTELNKEMHLMDWKKTFKCNTQFEMELNQLLNGVQNYLKDILEISLINRLNANGVYIPNVYIKCAKWKHQYLLHPPIKFDQKQSELWFRNALGNVYLYGHVLAAVHEPSPDHTAVLLFVPTLSGFIHPTNNWQGSSANNVYTLIQFHEQCQMNITQNLNEYIYGQHNKQQQQQYLQLTDQQLHNQQHPHQHLQLSSSSSITTATQSSTNNQLHHLHPTNILQNNLYNLNISNTSSQSPSPAVNNTYPNMNYHSNQPQIHQIHY